jgi:hypothetical protein
MKFLIVAKFYLILSQVLRQELFKSSSSSDLVADVQTTRHSDQHWLCGLIPHLALVGVREYDG